jgi:hypothetical protein
MGWKMRWLLFAVALSCAAQPVTVGVKAGFRTTNDLEGAGTSESKYYMFGPMVEVRLPYGFAFEADALYRRFGYSSTTYGLLGDTFTDRERANSWEFPLLLKYRLSHRGVRPFVSAGYAPRHIGGGSTASGFTVAYPSGSRVPYSYSSNTRYDTDHGLVAGFGVAWKFGRLHISPEARYVRWKHPPYSYEGSRGYYLLVPQNEVQVLLGMGF